MPLEAGRPAALLQLFSANPNPNASPGPVFLILPPPDRCLDALLFQFYAKNDGLRLTDLHQGIVWGTNTPQTVRDERLVNRFDYDSDYGTVLNRCVCLSP